MTFSRFAIDHLPDDEIRATLNSEKGLLFLGSVAPDLPYLSIATTHALKGESAIADDLHYRKTTAVPLGGLKLAREAFERGDVGIARGLFSFYVGYCSHLVADGIVHPFVRDMVGEYAVAKNEHRTLEMKLDVLMVHKHYGTDLNGMRFQEDLSWIDDSEALSEVYRTYAELISKEYGHALAAEHVERWAGGISLLLDFAEGNFPRWYRNVLGDKGALYKDYEDIKPEVEALTKLRMPIDAEKMNLSANFMGKDVVSFFDDVVPRYFDVFPAIIEKAYGFVFKGQNLDPELIPLINLDNGRLLVENELTKTPSLWSQA